MPELQLQKLFVLLFMMTGPLRVVPAFAGLTRDLDAAVRNRLANRAVLFVAAGAVLAVFVGNGILQSWGIPPHALAAATGLMLLLTALQALMGNSHAPGAPAEAEADPDRLALSPLAFPMILPPFAVGVLILFVAYYPSLGSQLVMAGLALGILAVDWLAMRFARQIMAAIGPTVLQVLGAVFGVLQLALATQMIFWGVRTAMVVADPAVAAP